MKDPVAHYVILTDAWDEAINFVKRNMGLPPDASITIYDKWASFRWRCKKMDCQCGIDMWLADVLDVGTKDKPRCYDLPKW